MARKAAPADADRFRDEKGKFEKYFSKPGECDVDGAAAGIAPRLHFKGDSDAHIVRGLIAILFAIYAGHRADQILLICVGRMPAEVTLRLDLTLGRPDGRGLCRGASALSPAVSLHDDGQE